MTDVPLIVVGASAGGLDAIGTVLRELSPEIPAAILAVIHIGDFDADLPLFFKDRSPLPVAFAQDGAPIEPAKVYFAPPDHHLLVEKGRLCLGRGPRENHARPAIDPLFRSAAEIYGPLVTGVILTGYLTDGTAGLWEVKRRGGVTIVQDPDEADVPEMPASALLHVAVDHCLGLAAIGRLLNNLATDAATKAPQSASHAGGADMEYTADVPIALTCATCGGALSKMTKGSYTQFRCHIGHTFGTPELAKEQFEQLRATLESLARLLNERVKFFRATASEVRIGKLESAAAVWDAAADESESRFDDITKLLTAEWKRPELIPASGAKLKLHHGPSRDRGGDGSRAPVKRATPKAAIRTRSTRKEPTGIA